MNKSNLNKERIIQFFKFTFIGALGFLVDVIAFYLFNIILNNFFSRLISFLSAVIFTYIFNKRITFKNSHLKENFWKEFIPYLFSMILGGSVNLFTFFSIEKSNLFFFTVALFKHCVGQLRRFVCQLLPEYFYFL